MPKQPVALIILDGFAFRDEVKEMQLHKQINRILIVIGMLIRMRH